MKIERLELHGFGRLHALDLPLSSRFNVIAGPNEAGKSTLAEALQAMLFGLTDSATSHMTKKDLARFRPWDGGRFGGILEVCRQNGERYRIARDFDASETILYREPGATDETARYNPGRHGWIDFATRHLGMTRTVFRACGWIDQGTLDYEKSDVSTLKGKLESLADAPGSETSAEAALSKLREWRKDRLNPDAHSIANSPYRTAKDKVESLKAELAESRGILASLDNLAVAERERAAKLARCQDELAAIDRLLARRELTLIDDKQRRLATLDRDLAETDARLRERADVASLARDAFEAATRALERAENTAATVADLAATVERERPARERVSNELDRLSGALANLPHHDPSAIARADQEVHNWELAAQAHRDAANRLATTRQRLQELETTADPALGNVADGTSAAALTEAIHQAAGAADRLDDARVVARAAKVPPEIEAEHDRLDQSLDGVSAAALRELEARDDRLRLAEAHPATPGIASIAGVALAAALGAVFGFLALGAAGAVVGIVILGALGWLVARQLHPANPAAAGLAKNRATLQVELSRHGVASVQALRAAWDRRQELAEAVRQARAARQQLAMYQQTLDQHLNALESLCATRDLEAARHIVAALQKHERQHISLGGEFQSAATAAEQAEARLARARRPANDALAALGGPAETAAQAREIVTTARENQGERSQLLQRQTELTAKQDGYDRSARQLAARQETLADAQTERDQCFQALGIDAPVTEPRAALETRRARFDEYRDALGRRANLRVSRDSLIGAENPADWAARAEVLGPRAAGADPRDTRAQDELERRRRAIATECDSHRGTLQDLHQQRELALNGIRPPAELAEQLAEAEQELAGLEHLKNALDDAIALLGAAATDFRRDFAPRLASGIGDDLARITAGRYQEVAVDPTSLTIRIKSAERGDLVVLDNLSHGTRDAVHILLRATIARLLGSANEPVPLFLDDPLVHVDPARAHRLLDVFAEVAQRTQIFYFTQDQRVISWAQTHPEARIHELASS